ncbi:nuclear autoantigenic sperm protein homolog isoform X2 [Chironomus tepperi]|uniref:nuclear autoantigenic sperm protein homolog isoform X2 n=1 Tax=Chironomus tepperi TaxID=113505 RepID=UPI00391F6926
MAEITKKEYPEKLRAEKILKAKEVYGRGCRNYYVKDYGAAADDFSDATKMYERIYGTNGDEIGEVYLMYAKALIALEQNENKLLEIREELTDSDHEVSDSEKKGPEEKLKDLEELVEKLSEPRDTKVDSKDDEAELKNSEKENDEEEDADEEEESEGGEGPDPEDENETSDSEDPYECFAKEYPIEEIGNLQIAWDALQNATFIFEQRNEQGLSLLVDVYDQMAAISIENENFSVALEDYARALAAFDRIVESERNYRIAAEIHYKIGLCQTFEKSFDESVKSYQRAHDLLSEVVEKEKLKEQTDEVVANIKDMEETLQEILNKINETDDIKAEEIEKVKKELVKFYSKMNAPADNNEDQPFNAANDISHLVKRKKPDVSDSNIECSPAKKQVVENEDEIQAVSADDEKKMIAREESLQPAIED